MANKNFVVQNGLTVGPLSADAVSGNVSTTGNVTANVFVGNGAGLTGVTGSYGNANVAAYLPTYTGNIGAGNLSVTGDITDLGNASVSGNVTAGSLVIAPSGKITGNWTSGATRAYFQPTGSALGRVTLIPGAGAVGASETSQLTAFTSLLTTDTGNAAFLNFGIANSVARLYSGTNGTDTVRPLVIDANGGNAIVIAANSTQVRMPGTLSVVGNITAAAISSTGNVIIAGAGTGTYVSPIRSTTGQTLSVYYDDATKEVTYGNISGGTYSNANVAAYLPTYTGNLTANNISTVGNITFPANSRIYGDFSNATVASRTLFQTPSNTSTSMGVIPGEGFTGTGSTPLASLTMFGNADAGNSSSVTLRATPSQMLVVSGNSGTGVRQPLSVGVNGFATMIFSNTSSAVSATGAINAAGNITTSGVYSSTGNVIIAGAGTGTYVSPVRSVVGGAYMLYYDPTTKEVAYDTTGTVTYGNAQVAQYLPVYGGNLLANVVSTTGNIYANTDTSILAYGTTTSGYGAIYTGPTGYTPLPSTTIQVTSNANTYSQMNMENTNTGPAATSDYVATADTGSDTQFFVDLGVAGSGYNGTNPVNRLGTALFSLDSYLYAQGNGTTAGTGGNLVVGTNTPDSLVKIIAGGSNTANVVMTISPSNVSMSGNVVTSGNLTVANVGMANLFASGSGQFVGTVTANRYLGDGSQLTGIVGTVSNAQITNALSNYSGNLNNVNDMVVGGNLQVNGNVTYVDVSTLSVSDIVITVANDANTPSVVNGAGLLVGNNLAGNTAIASWLYNYAGNSWQTPIDIEPTVAATNTLDLGSANSRWSNVWLNAVQTPGNVVIGSGQATANARQGISIGFSASGNTVEGNISFTATGTVGVAASSITATGNVAGLIPNMHIHMANVSGLGQDVRVTSVNGNVIGIAARTGSTITTAMSSPLFNAKNGQQNYAIAIGPLAGVTNQQFNAVAIGASAGGNTQGINAVAIGLQAGATLQEQSSVAIGHLAAAVGISSQGVAIGYQTGGGGQLGQQGVAIGSQAAYYGQGAQAIAIGAFAATGTGPQGTAAVAIGYEAGRYSQQGAAVALGQAAGQYVQGVNAVAIGYQAGRSALGANGVAIGYQTSFASSGGNTVAIGYKTGYSLQGYNSVAIGLSAGGINQSLGLGSSTAVGPYAGSFNQGTGAVALGQAAGQSVQGNATVAIGQQAGLSAQGAGAVAIGQFAGAGSQGQNSIAVGPNAQGASTGARAVAIGGASGYQTQADEAIAVGYQAGYSIQGATAVAVGFQAQYQSAQGNAIALGRQAGYFTQGSNSIAIGSSAGLRNLAANAIAMGYQAGQTFSGQQSVYIGMNAGAIKSGNSVVLIGGDAGSNTDPVGNMIAIGSKAAQVNGGKSVVIGHEAAGNGLVYADSTVIGYQAALSGTGSTGAVIIGSGAQRYKSIGQNGIVIGYQAVIANNSNVAAVAGSNAIAIGYSAQSSGDSSISIGNVAGAAYGAANAISIGTRTAINAPNDNTIAIGHKALDNNGNNGNNAIVIGSFAINGTNTVAANAVAIGSGLTSAPNSGLYVKPVRQISNPGGGMMMYDGGTNEITYGPQLWFQGKLSGDITPTSNTDTTFAWNNNNDPASWWSSSNQRIIPNRVGWYKVTLKVVVGANNNGATGQLNTQIRVNGTNQGFSAMTSNQAQYNSFALMNETMVYLGNTADYITATVYPTTSGQTVTGGVGGSVIIVQWISN